MSPTCTHMCIHSRSNFGPSSKNELAKAALFSRARRPLRAAMFCCCRTDDDRGAPVSGPISVVRPISEGIPKQPEAPVENARAKEPAKQEIAAPLEEPVEDGLALTFAHEDCTSVITLRRTPLGFRFNLQKPILVSFVHEGGHAESVGVKVGMELLAINGTSIDQDSPKQVFSKLQVAIAKFAAQ